MWVCELNDERRQLKKERSKREGKKKNEEGSKVKHNGRTAARRRIWGIRAWYTKKKRER